MTRTWTFGLALALVALVGCGGGVRHDGAALPGGQLGIEVLGVELTAGGDLARLNYRVIDYELAKRTLQGEVRLETDAALSSLELLTAGRLGAIRQRPTRTGKKQFMLFTNGGRLLKPGDTVALTVGAARVAGIPVI